MTLRLPRLGSRCRVYLAALLATAAVLLPEAHAETRGSDVPRTLLLDIDAPAAQWLPKVVPAGARLLHGPVTLPFGAHASGRYLAWRTAEGGYAAVYLTPDADDAQLQRWFWLREPRDADFDVDVEVRSVLSMGPAQSRDIVVLETWSRAAPAGGSRDDGGTVYRRVDDGVQPVPTLTELLAGVPDAAAARLRLAPEYRRLLPVVPGRLATLFATLPWPHVELTALERLQRLLPGNPLHQTYDSNNGFLDIRGDAGLPGYHAALFRHAGGGWLLAVQKRWPDAQRTWFMRQAADDPATWTDVSAVVMPGFDARLAYALPRRGLQVQLPSTGDGAAMRWTWDGSRFVRIDPASG
jgi:hypothetical protein